MLRRCSEDAQRTFTRLIAEGSGHQAKTSSPFSVTNCVEEETEIFCDLFSRFELFEIKREGFFEKLTRLEHNDCPRIHRGSCPLAPRLLCFRGYHFCTSQRITQSHKESQRVTKNHTESHRIAKKPRHIGRTKATTKPGRLIIIQRIQHVQYIRYARLQRCNLVEFARLSSHRSPLTHCCPETSSDQSR